MNVQRRCLLPDEWRQKGRGAAPGTGADGSRSGRDSWGDDTVQQAVGVGEGGGALRACDEGDSGDADSCRGRDDAAAGGVVEAVLHHLFFSVNEP